MRMSGSIGGIDMGFYDRCDVCGRLLHLGVHNHGNTRCSVCGVAGHNRRSHEKLRPQFKVSRRLAEKERDAYRKYGTPPPTSEYVTYTASSGKEAKEKAQRYWTGGHGGGEGERTSISAMKAYRMTYRKKRKLDNR